MTKTADDGGFTVAMRRATETPGVDIVDPIERRRCTLLTEEPVDLTETASETFRFPVETAVSIETSTVSAPFTGHAYVRNGEGNVLAEAANGFRRDFPSGTYSLELTGLIKVYLEFDGEFTLENAYDALSLEFPRETEVRIGSRSLHRRPATTVTVTDEPRDLMAAISTFGSALKTVSPERSFPTWRGHPPEIAFGDNLEIPEELEPPVSEAVIEVPPSYEYLYPTAPLAYYLGMGVESGHTPRIVGDGIDHLLTHPQGYDRAVEETLQQVFLLDCITRTEGLYPVELLERNRLEERVDLPWADLYGGSIIERLQAYLDIPFRTIADIVPDWRLAAHVEAEAASAPMLPYLSNDLAVITMATSETVPANEPVAGVAGGFTRGAAASDDTLVRPRGGPEAIETAWVSEGMAVDATKAVVDAYRNRIGRQPQEETIEITVVCNSDDMNEEREVIDEVYGSHEEMPFEVAVHEQLTTDELASIIGQDSNFLHYIGHIDETGFRCPDGRLDVAGVDTVGPEAFFLNACQSYEQGLSLIEGGAIGGIVTLHDVVNHGAVRIGQMVARLLNIGFPLRAALDIAGSQSVVGRQYVVVGDGTLSIVQPPSGTPQVYHVESTESGYCLEMDGFGAPPGMGCMYLPYVEGNNTQYLASGRSMPFELDEQELHEVLSMENVPVENDDELRWSYEFLPDS